MTGTAARLDAQATCAPRRREDLRSGEGDRHDPSIEFGRHHGPDGDDGIGRAEQMAITDSALNGWALGDADFLASLQQSTARRVVKARVGRPSSAKQQD